MMMCCDTADRTAAFQCSSASRKFLNLRAQRRKMLRDARFSALQRAENSSINDCGGVGEVELRFQCSSASRKFLNTQRERNNRRYSVVSVLFSEPKIPQSAVLVLLVTRIERFSALQRAENSSIQQALDAMTELVKFQCSSASRKFLNRDGTRGGGYGGGAFQCSSASRKFLNRDRRVRSRTLQRGFSALQRAENSSIERYADLARRDARVSVLFSEPKIPQCWRCPSCTPTVSMSFSALQRAENSSIVRATLDNRTRVRVSVLFSEPKIPQCKEGGQQWRGLRSGFSALQRAENSSMNALAESVA